ncbi:MAG: hypothetical protein KIT11_01705 [Fimbriimonadaceae bacterium]|nr:hypothetical protein [Fimbriimonadaceae bacterium]QYK54914.1 MAG: hypothetical protein KF733_07830 [Fimbriimonadaceae bacterium]
MLVGGLASAQDAWYRVKISVPDEATMSRVLDSDLRILDCVPARDHVDAVIGPGEAFKLVRLGLRYEYERQIPPPTPGVPGLAASGTANFQAEDYRTRYFNADEIIAFFETLRSQHPTYVTRRTIGTSINGETMYAYRLGRPIRTGAKPEASFVILGLQHAREWVSGSVIMHVAKKTVEGLTTPQSTPFLTNQLVWIVPITNPDGYRYTWTNDRYWRKNRRNTGSGFFGVDLNRNWSVGWGGNNGSSGSRGSETYRGTAAFSEPETANVRDFVATLERVRGMIDFHSYSQLVLWPWGYQTSQPPTRNVLEPLAVKMVNSMNFGARYSQGQTATTLYIASGVAPDFMYETYNRAPSYTIELRDEGQFGFELPPSQISPTQDEAWAAFKVMLTELPGY